MIKALLIPFAVVVFALLAASWLIHDNIFRWQCAAFGSWAASFLRFNDFALPRRRNENGYLALNLGKYGKLITALAGAAVIIVGRTFGIDSAYYLDLTALLTALGVWAVPNATNV